MAAGPSPMTAPPTPGGGAPGPTIPPVASPSPAQANPTMQQGTALAIGVARSLQTIAKMFPSTAPAVADMNNKLRDVVSSMMEDSQSPEPAAPPQG